MRAFRDLFANAADDTMAEFSFGALISDKRRVWRASKNPTLSKRPKKAPIERGLHSFEPLFTEEKRPKMKLNTQPGYVCNASVLGVLF